MWMRSTKKTTPAPTATGKDAETQGCVPALSLLCLMVASFAIAFITPIVSRVTLKGKAH